MGTRSLTVFLSEWDQKEIVVMYSQYDGYPTGHGKELQEFLNEFVVVNGLTNNDPPKTANGMGCLAAQVIAHFKKEMESIYLYPAGTRDVGEEWVYTVYKLDKGVGLRVQSGCVTAFGISGTSQCDMDILYDGPVENFDPELVEKRYHAMDQPEPTSHYGINVFKGKETEK